ncbi:hypothetical protein SUDANB145_04624 [Streptomyces sp. enrichment culture]|uniref:hypothetical protein n=1 Tax=Streptomyces sp. enrichment culture TaxID=1795815 RepID=UPI003F555D23
MIKVQTAAASCTELNDEDRLIFRAIVREIRQASYIFDPDTVGSRFLELLSAVRAEQKSADVTVEISADQMEWLGELAYRTCEHLGAEEFSIRTGRTLQEAQDLLDRLTPRSS